MKFRRPLNMLEGERRQNVALAKVAQDEALVVVCENCKRRHTATDLARNIFMCDGCGNHFRLGARMRLAYLFDDGKFDELFANLEPKNILGFEGYDKKLQAAATCGETEAVITTTGIISGIKTAVFAMEPNFMMGSMGSVVGEKIVRLFEYATCEKLSVVGYSVSGGARMQEGILSLMQMAKTAGALKRHSDAGLLYISVLTNPTTGGVTASFASLGDINIAEPAALIGFAGPRVIEQTIRKKLPVGFQRAEFVLEKGFIDLIVPRQNHKEVIGKLLKLHEKVGRNRSQNEGGEHGNNKNSSLYSRALTHDVIDSKAALQTAFEKVKLARATTRPTFTDYLKLFDGFAEMHGDRVFGDDKAIIGGVGYFDKTAVTIIGIDKGKEIQEKLVKNFGMPHPEGYRKALRLMKQAEKFGRPIICFVDTAGAYPGLEAEERGQGEAIAKNLAEMMALRTPILSIIIGEGGSGGALALAVANYVAMAENAIYSVISPEGCASILWKDPSRVAEACNNLKCTADDLLELGVIEKIISETGTSLTEETMKVIEKFLKDFGKTTADKIVGQRYERFRKLGY